MQPYSYIQGRLPLIVSIPHAGTYVPDTIARRMTAEARRLPDTDWHVDRLYDFAPSMGASVIIGNYSRYVVDLNRPPDDAPLYPGAATPGICPRTLFNGNPVYLDNQAPGPGEVEERIEAVWRPYHERLQETTAENIADHGHALIYEAHSIRSVERRLFPGVLPDLNLSTNDARSADETLQKHLHDICRSAKGYTSVINGRFKGGYITRHYGRPDRGMHAVQLELSQRTYMTESYPYEYVPEAAEQVRTVLVALVQRMLAWRPVYGGSADAKVP